MNHPSIRRKEMPTVANTKAEKEKYPWRPTAEEKAGRCTGPGGCGMQGHSLRTCFQAPGNEGLRAKAALSEFMGTPCYTAPEIVDYVVSEVERGAGNVLLFHDGGGDRTEFSDTYSITMLLSRRLGVMKPSVTPQ